MAVIIKLNDNIIRDNFLKNFFKCIKEGTISTWKHDNNSNISISNSKWYGKAWFGFYLKDDEIGCGLIAPHNAIITREIYGVYHGRLIATLLANFDSQISKINVTPDFSEIYDLLYIHS